MPHCQRHEFAGADDVNEPQAGQLEVDSALGCRKSSQRLTELVLGRHVRFAIKP
jgi:hypothetical protein